MNSLPLIGHYVTIDVPVAIFVSICICTLDDTLCFQRGTKILYLYQDIIINSHYSPRTLIICSHRDFDAFFFFFLSILKTCIYFLVGTLKYDFFLVNKVMLIICFRLTCYISLL